MQSTNSEYGSPFIYIHLFDVRPPLSLDTKIKAFCFTLTTETYLNIVVKATYSVSLRLYAVLKRLQTQNIKDFIYCFVLPM